MVGQVPLYAGHLHVVDTIVAQHLLSYITASHTIRQGYFRKFLKLMVQVGLHNVAEQDGSDKDYPDKAHRRGLWSLLRIALNRLVAIGTHRHNLDGHLKLLFEE